MRTQLSGHLRQYNLLSQVRLRNYLQLRQILELEAAAIMRELEAGAQPEQGRYRVLVTRGPHGAKQLEVR